MNRGSRAERAGRRADGSPHLLGVARPDRRAETDDRDELELGETEGRDLDDLVGRAGAAGRAIAGQQAAAERRVDRLGPPNQLRAAGRGFSRDDDHALDRRPRGDELHRRHGATP